mgnify:CR=1 FL=1
MNNEKSAIQVIAGAARCPEYSPSMVKALMKKLETNEKAFALLMNVTPSTVRLWTTGAARPCGMARRLMQIYETGPEKGGSPKNGMKEQDVSCKSTCKAKFDDTRKE